MLSSSLVFDQNPVAERYVSATSNANVANSIFPDHPKLELVFQFIEAHYGQSITLCDVARDARYSPAYLTDLVRRETGKTVNHWIIQRRMVEVHRLLLETNQSVNQISETIGYNNPGHFFRQFRQHYGTTPQA